MARGAFAIASGRSVSNFRSSANRGFILTPDTLFDFFLTAKPCASRHAPCAMRPALFHNNVARYNESFFERRKKR